MEFNDPGINILANKVLWGTPQGSTLTMYRRTLSSRNRVRSCKGRQTLARLVELKYALTIFELEMSVI